jgi:hypothetical protein
MAGDMAAATAAANAFVDRPDLATMSPNAKFGIQRGYLARKGDHG